MVQPDAPEQGDVRGAEAGKGLGAADAKARARAGERGEGDR